MEALRRQLTIEQKVRCLSDGAGELKARLALFVRASELAIGQALTAARALVELLVLEIVKTEGFEARRDLADNIETLGGKDDKAVKRRNLRPAILPPPVYAALHSLRIYGNTVVHAIDHETLERRDRAIDATDLQVALATLMRIVEWYCASYLRPPVDPLYVGMPAPALGAFCDAPPDATGLRGRDAELAELADWLGDPRVRVIAIVAPGGMGKTSLGGRAVLDRVGAAPDARLAWFDLQADPTFAEITGRLLASLGTDEQPDDPAIAELGYAARSAAIVRRLCERDTIVVLDNFETWLAPSDRTPRDAGVGELIAQVVQKAHRGTLVITSRIAPDLPSTHAGRIQTLALGPLPIDVAVRLLESEGLRGSPANLARVAGELGGNPRLALMFADLVRKRHGRDVDRALARDPGLATGHARRLLDEIVGELSPVARLALRLIAAAARPIALERLEAQARALDRADVEDPAFVRGTELALDAIWDELVPRALVREAWDGRGADGFVIDHPLIAEYALATWPVAAAAHTVLARHYLAAAGDDLDLASLSSALHHAIVAGDLELLASMVMDTMLLPMVAKRGATVQLIEPLARVCEAFPLDRDGDLVRLSIHMYFALALLAIGDRTRSERVLVDARARLGPLAGQPVDGQLASAIAAICRDDRRVAEAETHARHALAIARTHHASRDAIAALRVLSVMANTRGDRTAAIGFARDAEALAGGDPVPLLAVAILLGAADLATAPADARVHFERGLALARQLGDRRSEARCLQFLAELARTPAELRAALALGREAIVIRVEIRDRLNEGRAREGLARTLIALADHSDAREDLRAAAGDELRAATVALVELGARRELESVLAALGTLLDEPAGLATDPDVLARLTGVDADRWASL